DVSGFAESSAVSWATTARALAGRVSRIAAGAFGILLSLAIGLWTDSLIRDLLTRADWLGYAALDVLAVGILAILAL
ncbi:hypothetical protein ACC699_40630, partial [Rhizobium ruizarguesonis]